jgi:hypothetical protein
MMLGEVAAGLALSLVAVWFVLRPVLRPETVGQGTGDGGMVAEVDEEDVSPRARALGALKEIEFDRATGKLSDADYAELKAKYTAEALVALRDEGRGTGEGGGVDIPAPARSASPVPRPTCPVHGPRHLGDASYCDECGRRLTSGHGFCGACGAPLTAGAGFCNACGGRVAA